MLERVLRWLPGRSKFKLTQISRGLRVAVWAAARAAYVKERTDNLPGVSVDALGHLETWELPRLCMLLLASQSKREFLASVSTLAYTGVQGE